MSHQDDNIRFERAKADGLNIAQAATAIGKPQSTLYRWRALYRQYNAVGLKNGSCARHNPPPHTARTPELIEAIIALRQAAPCCEEILTERLRHKEFFVSASTVRRVLRELLDKGTISCSGAGKWFAIKHPRKWLWAQRRRQKLIITAPGEVVQIDHTKIHLATGIRVIVFAVTNLSSKTISRMAASRPTAASATRFLQQLIENLPFPVRQIHSRWRSELWAEFELSCQQRGIVLFVIPPHSPKYNSELPSYRCKTPCGYLANTSTLYALIWHCLPRRTRKIALSHSVRVYFSLFTGGRFLTAPILI